MKKVKRLIMALVVGLIMATLSILVAKLVIKTMLWVFSAGYSWEAIPFIVITVMCAGTFYNDSGKEG